MPRTMISNLAIALGILLGAVLLGGAWTISSFPQQGLAQQPGPLPKEAVPVITDAMLMNAQQDAQDWLLNGHDYTNQRYSGLTQITPANVAQLTPRWIFHTGVQNPIEASPIVAGGLMFLTTSYDHVIAMDAATGQVRWRYDPTLGPAVFCCGPVNRGVAVAYGKVFVARLDSTLVALDARTGKELWATTVADWRQGYA